MLAGVPAQGCSHFLVPGRQLFSGGVLYFQQLVFSSCRPSNLNFLHGSMQLTDQPYKAKPMSRFLVFPSKVTPRKKMCWDRSFSLSSTLFRFSFHAGVYVHQPFYFDAFRASAARRSCSSMSLLKLGQSITIAEE